MDLSSLALTSTLPQFLITLPGFTGTLGSVVVTLTWDATYDPSCLSTKVSSSPPVPTANTTPTTTAILRETASSSAGPMSIGALAAVLMGGGMVIIGMRRRAHR